MAKTLAEILRTEDVEVVVDEQRRRVVFQLKAYRYLGMYGNFAEKVSKGLYDTQTTRDDEVRPDLVICGD